MNEIEQTLIRDDIPLIVIVGQLLNPIEVYVYFMGIKYNVKRVVHALDVSLKIYKLFRIEYPVACTLVWTFIQKYLYKLITPTDKQHPSIEILMKQLEKAKDTRIVN